MAHHLTDQRQRLLDWYHQMIARTPEPRRQDYPSTEKWLRACGGRERVIQTYSHEYTAAVLTLERES